MLQQDNENRDMGPENKKKCIWNKKKEFIGNMNHDDISINENCQWIGEMVAWKSHGC